MPRFKIRATLRNRITHNVYSDSTEVEAANPAEAVQLAVAKIAGEFQNPQDWPAETLNIQHLKDDNDESQ